MITVVAGAAVSPFAFAPHTAHAQFGGPAFEINPIVVGGIGLTAAGTAPKNILDALAWTVAKVAVQSITRSTVNWINSGFNGSPAFVSDLNQNLKFLGDAVADNFFNQLNRTAYDATGFNITSPFQDQINQKLREEYYRTTGSWGLNYTLYQDSTDPRAFINGDFDKGGFNAFLSASQNPANNPFGAYMLASNALWNQVDAAAQQRKAELNWGNGFLPWRGECNTTAIPSNDYNAQMAGAFPDAFTGATAPVSLSQAEKCPFNSVRTPGSVIESQLEQNLGTGVRQLELADSINEIVGALIGQLVNQVLGSGGLRGASLPSAGGGSSFIDEATSPSQLSSQTTSLGNGVLQNIANNTTSITLYRNNWQKILSAANSSSCRSSDIVDATIAKATVNVAHGNASLNRLATLKTEVSSAIQDTSANASTKVITAVNDYQSYLSSTDTPSDAEVADSTFQASDTSESTGTQSLYTQVSNCR
jgi:hypothetical protein